jgi:VWFA-related protein
MKNPPQAFSAGPKSIVALAALAGFLAFSPAPTPGRQTQEPPLRLAKPLQHEITVQLKLVQVYVTDGKSRPVPDLKKEDFAVFDNGKPMTITEFERHIIATSPDKVPAPRPAAPPAAVQVTTATAASAEAPAPAMSRKFLLFFDFANNNQRGARKSQDAALRFLDTEVRPSDEVGLVSYSLTRGLSVHEFLTLDHDKIRSAVAVMDAKGLAGRGDEVEQEYWRQVTEGTPSIGFDTGQSDSTYKTNSPYSWRRQETKSQALNFILKLTALAKGLRYVPGQKMVILFSSGIPNSLIYGNQAGSNQASYSGSRTAFDTGDQILRSQNEDMLKELAAANCSIYSFDVREAAMVPSLFNYDEQTFDNRSHKYGRDIFTESGVQQNNDMIYRDDRTTGLYSLRRLAKSTGGKYYSNIDRYADNLDDLQSMTSAFYVIGYSVPQNWNGEFHTLRVEVKRKGVDVRAQSGYFNPQPFRELSDLEKQLHLLDLAVSEAPLFQAPLPASLTALDGSPGSPNNLVLLGQLPTAAVAKLSGTKVEMVTFVFDEYDNLADLRRSEHTLAGYKDRPVFYASQASLPPGAYKCRLIVRDMDSGEAAVATTRAFVPGIVINGIRLHTPLVLGPAANGAYLESRASRRTAPSAGVSWADLYPFDASRFMPLLEALPQGTARIGVVLPCSIAGLVNARIAVRAAIVNMQTAEKLPLMLIPTAQSAGEGTVVQTFEIPTAALPPGKYVFYFYAEDTASKSLAHTTTVLTVK